MEETMQHSYEIVDRIRKTRTIDRQTLEELLTTEDAGLKEYLAAKAKETAQQIYGNQIYMRGLIEFTNYCKNDCYYCGIRCSNEKADRYRLSMEQILECCKNGYELGFRTFVLQGGEDGYYTDA